MLLSFRAPVTASFFIMRFYATLQFLYAFFRRQAFGSMPLLANRLRTSVLFSNVLGCNAALAVEVFLVTLKLVISVAGSFALMVMVGRKSASGLLSGIPIFFFHLHCRMTAEQLIAFAPYAPEA